MSSWPSSELDTIAAADELTVASLRRDGTLARPRVVWVLRHGDDLYIRSVNGATAAWDPSTQVRREGHVNSGALDKDVTFVDATDLNEEIDKATASSTAATPAASSTPSPAFGRATPR